MGNLSYQSQYAAQQGSYRPRDPSESAIFKIVQKNWRRFEQEACSKDKTPSYYVEREFEEFLGCGILGRGFVRLKCDTCAENRLVPFSCKRRGFCPSCCGRRMNEGAAFLVDHVFPQVPVRQWVLSFPIPVRFWMARNPRLITQALEIFHRAIAAHYKKCAKNLGASGDLRTGAVTVVQRFGSALNLNIHFHALVLDGVYAVKANGDEKSVQFIESPRLTQTELLELMQMIQKRMFRAFQRRGLVQKLESENGGDAELTDETTEALCQGASVQYRVATGKPQGQPVRRIGCLGFVGEKPVSTSELSAVIGGYSLHANTYIHKNNRAELERMCRYILRPPIAEERIDLRGDSVVYRLKSQWRDGTRAIVLSGTEFIEKLVALIPQPGIHLTRFHGILGPHAKLRSLVVPSPQVIDQSCIAKTGEDSFSKKKAKRHKLRWAELLRRVFNIDLERCPCGGRVQFVAAIMKRDVIVQILEHLELPTEIPEFAPP